MSKHIHLVKSLTTKSIEAIEKLANGQPKDSQNQIIDVREFEVPSSDNSSAAACIRRCFVSTVDSGEFVNVGWVINEKSIGTCLICQVPFGLLHWKHHCRACGNLVCQKCSKFTSKIKAFEELGLLKVCSECHKSKVRIFSTTIII